MSTVQQVIAGQDAQRAATTLLGRLSEAASGQDGRISSTDAELVQGILRGNWSTQVKRLAYDLCKAVPTSDADAQFIISSIKTDVTTGSPDMGAQALRFLPHLPPHVLANMLEIGDLAQVAGPALSSDDDGVRAAAVSSLSAVLLLPEVARAAAGSAGMANQVQEHWQTLTDALLDDTPSVVAAAVAATASLLLSGADAQEAQQEGFLLRRLAVISAARVAAALGPVLASCATVPLQAQPDVARLLLLLVATAVREGWWEAVEAGGSVIPGVPAGTLVPSLGVLAPAACAHLMGLLKREDPATKLDAARSVLRIAALVSGPGAAQAAAAGVGSSSLQAASTAVALPQEWISECVHELLVLQETRPYAEAAAAEVLGVAVEGLPLLAPAQCRAALRSLWPAISRVKLSQQRVKLLASAWAAAVEGGAGALPGASTAASTGLSGAAAGATQAKAGAELGALLGDPFLSAVMSGRAPPGPAGPAPAPPAPGPSASAREGMLSSAAAAIGMTIAPSTKDAGAASKGVSTSDLIAGMPASPALPTAAASGKGANPAAAGPTGGGAKSKGSHGGQEGAGGGGGKKASKFLSSLGSMMRREKSEVDKERTGSMMGGAVPEEPSPVDVAGPAAGPTGTSGGDALAELLSLDEPSPVAPVQQQQSGSVTGGEASAGTSGHEYEAGLQLGALRHLPGANFGSLRHELVCTLLSTVAALPGAAASLDVCSEAASAAAHDRLPASSSSAAKAAPALGWLRVARSALQSTAACVTWEPLVSPAITQSISSAAQGHVAADFSTMAGDAWLQLMLAAATTARALRASLASDPSSSGLPGNTPVQRALFQGPAGAGVQPPVNPLAAEVDAIHGELQGLLMQLLREWATLSRAIRPRAMWVVGRCMDFSGLLQPAGSRAPGSGPGEAAWELGLRALHDTLCRAVAAGSAVRVGELLASAASGALLQSGRQGWPADRPFVFDVVAASTLCEKPEYEACGAVVGLSVAQAWAQALQDALAQGAGGRVRDAAEAERVAEAVVALAGRLDALLREFSGTPEAASAPQLRDWVRRILRTLGACALFTPPAVAQAEAAAAAAAAAEGAEGEAGQAGEDGQLARTFSNSSSSSSEASSPGAGGAGLLPVSLPTNMYLPPGAPRPPPPAPVTPAPAFGAQQGAEAGGLQGQNSTTSPSSPPANGFTRGTDALAATSPFLKTQGSFRSRAAAAQGATKSSYLVKSGLGDAVWGYPFAPGPRSLALFNSKRTRRHRTLAKQISQALAHLHTPSTNTTSAAAASSAATTARLDSPDFWSSLPGPAQGQQVPQELGGPGDPLLLAGSVAVGQEPGTVQVRLVATNRSRGELRGATVLVAPSGPAQVDKRGLSWSVPRMSPGDRATHSFTMRLLGYGRVAVELSVQLLPAPSTTGAPAAASAPVLLRCAPLAVNAVTHMLRPPVGLPPPGDTFFRVWGALPARADLSAVCAWPGREGAALVLSCMLRTPLVPSLLSYTPATASYQAAFAGETVAGEEVAVLVLGSLLPPPAPTDQKQGKSLGAAEGTGEEGNGANGAEAHGAASPHPAEPRAMFQVLVRSTQSEVVAAVTRDPRSWLRDLAGGCLELAGAPGAAQPHVRASGAPKPSLHPRVAALHATFTQGAKALPPTLGSLLLGPWAGAGTAGADGAGAGLGGLDVYAKGSLASTKVSHKWMEAAALAEWQRLVALSS